MEKTKKVNPKKSSQCKKFAIFSIIIFILEKRKKYHPAPLYPPTHLIYSINLTLFWSWKTVWDTKTTKLNKPSTKKLKHALITALLHLSVRVCVNFVGKMSGITLPRTLLLKKTPPASTEINEIRLPYT